MVSGNDNESKGEAFRLPPIHKLVSDVAPASEILGSLRYGRGGDPRRSAKQAFVPDRAELKGSISSPSRKNQVSQSSTPGTPLGARNGEHDSSTSSGSGTSSTSGAGSLENNGLQDEGQDEERGIQEEEESGYQEEQDDKRDIIEPNSSGSSSERSETSSRSPHGPSASLKSYSRSIEPESTAATVPGLNKSFISGKANPDKPYLKEFDEDPRSAFLSYGGNNDGTEFPAEKRSPKVPKRKKKSTPSSALQDYPGKLPQLPQKLPHDTNLETQHDTLHDTQHDTQHDQHETRQHLRQHRRHEIPQDIGDAPHDKRQDEHDRQDEVNDERQQDSGRTNENTTVKGEPQLHSEGSFSSMQPLEPQPKSQDGTHYSQIPVYSFMHVSPSNPDEARGKFKYSPARGGGNKHILNGNTPNAAFSRSPQPLPQLPPWIPSMKSGNFEPSSASTGELRSPSSATNPYDSLNGMSISTPKGTLSPKQPRNGGFEANSYASTLPNSATSNSMLASTGSASSGLDSSAKSEDMYSGQPRNVFTAPHTSQPGQFYYPYSHYASLPTMMQYSNAQYHGNSPRDNMLYSAASSAANAQPQMMMQHTQLPSSLSGYQPQMAHMPSSQAQQVPMQSLQPPHPKFAVPDKQEHGEGVKPLSSAMNGSQPQPAKEQFSAPGGNNSSHPEFHIIDSATGRHLVAEAPRRRGNLPKDVTNILRAWLSSHLGNPYPTEDDKLKLVEQTGLSMIQVSNWFINARRRNIPATHRKSKYSHYRPEADKSNYHSEGGEKRKASDKDKRPAESI